MTMSKEISAPSADDPHNTAGGSDKLPIMDETHGGQQNNARAGTKSGDEITKKETRTADSSVPKEGRELVQGKKIKREDATRRNGEIAQ